MGAYFYIGISLKDFLLKTQNLLIKYDVHVYFEYNNKEKRWYEKLDFSLLESPLDNNYVGFFFSMKLIDVNSRYILFTSLNDFTDNNWLSFYDDEIYPFTIEGEGGRTNNDKIEIVKLRMIAKNRTKISADFIPHYKGNSRKIPIS